MSLALHVDASRRLSHPGRWANPPPFTAVDIVEPPMPESISTTAGTAAESAIYGHKEDAAGALPHADGNIRPRPRTG